MSDEREQIEKQKWYLSGPPWFNSRDCGLTVLVGSEDPHKAYTGFDMVMAVDSWGDNEETPEKARIFAKHIVDLHNASLKPIKWTHDKALAQCPCCASADVGAAGSIAHCYKCGLEIRGDSHQHTLDKWNTRDGVLLEPPEA